MPAASLVLVCRVLTIRQLQHAPMLQVRVLLYLGSLCSGILEALADVERAVVAAVASQTPG